MVYLRYYLFRQKFLETKMKVDHILRFNDLCIQAITNLFLKNYKNSNTHKEVQVPDFQTQFLIQIALRGKNHLSSMFIGLSQETCEDILKEVLSLTLDPMDRLEFVKSSFGELANVVACDLAVDPLFKNDYGDAHPTPPLVWTIGDNITPDFINGNGFSSFILKDQLKVYTCWLVVPYNAKDKESQSWSPTKSLSIYDPTPTK